MLDSGGLWLFLAEPLVRSREDDSDVELFADVVSDKRRFLDGAEVSYISLQAITAKYVNLEIFHCPGLIPHYAALHNTKGEWDVSRKFGM